MLTHKQRIYAEGRANGLSKKDAAIAAGCPEKSASQAASRYEKDPDIQAHVLRLGANPATEPAEKIQARATVQSGGTFKCPLEYMRSVMNEIEEDPKLRLDAAKALASYTVSKPGEKGKKEERQAAADKVASGSGRFGVAPAPLKVVK